MKSCPMPSRLSAPMMASPGSSTTPPASPPGSTNWSPSKDSGCPGLQLAHATDPSTGRRRLQVAGIDPDAAIFTSLQVEAKRRPPLGGRVAKAAGFGAVASLLLCCVIPLSAAAILGTAAATDFKQLENPVVLAGFALVFGVAGFALVFGVAGFAWLGRRRATTRCSC